ncbi:hypothetical protein BD410DRAFT_813314 [Rickenella mellea]|uniref:Phospholipase/carboxylesterase/thioesterase domain-containing protein n=1 Tax=Rickenella mellea TaxID=50990 RepID=A0A4Y7QDX5_9AGAM|nr:hypothetical protein BD410DRAFT_813314 [Rickenella mellea]
MASSELHVKPSENATQPRVKPRPQESAIPTPFTYFPSDDGTDENLLIILHGLGDTHVPFAKLGRQLKLPQTATLALQGPQQIPYLYEESFQWYPSFDPLGEMLERPDPTPALTLMKAILDHLTSNCGWHPDHIHLFGFAQGGSVAAEAGIAWWRASMERSSSAPSPAPVALGSIVTIGGPLLSYPTLSKLCPSPLLAFSRSAPGSPTLSASDMAAFRKGYESVRDVACAGEGMPRARDEWLPVMQFFSEKLARRVVGDVYEVLSSG